MRLASFALATVLSLAGCLPQDDDAEPSSSTADGTYQVTSRIDITLETVLPQPVGAAVQTLREFSNNPAHTMSKLADSAGLPAVGTLRDYMPGYLQGKLDGWINDEVAKLTIDGVPVTEVARSFVEVVESTLTQLSLESELTIDGRAVTHRLTKIDLSPMGIDQQLVLAAIPEEIVTADATASTETDGLKLNGHGFSIAYGEYAWRALDTAWIAKHGAGIRQTLGEAVGCATLADHVANKCAVGECVGHRTELAEICEAGLDELVGQLHQRVAAIQFEALHIKGGTAKITSDGLINGVWNLEINAGQGLRHVPATFTAIR